MGDSHDTYFLARPSRPPPTLSATRPDLLAGDKELDDRVDGLELGHGQVGLQRRMGWDTLAAKDAAEPWPSPLLGEN